MRTTRNQLFRVAAVFAIAMVVGAWTTSTRGGEDMALSINLLMDGYDDGWVPTKAPNILCIFHVAEQGTGTQPFTVTWSGDIFNYQGSSLNEDEFLPGAREQPYVQNVHVVDDLMDEDSDSIEVPVGSGGEGCEG